METKKITEEMKRQAIETLEAWVCEKTDSRRALILLTSERPEDDLNSLQCSKAMHGNELQCIATVTSACIGEKDDDFLRVFYRGVETAKIIIDKKLNKQGNEQPVDSVAQA